MTSKYKAQTGRTPLLSSDENTGERAQPSSQSVGQHSGVLSTPSMTITKGQSANTLPVENKDNTGNKTALHALMMRAALLSLEKTGLLRRYRVLSRNAAGKPVLDNTGKPVVKEIRIVLSPAIWTEDLRLLSEGVVSDNP